MKRTTGQLFALALTIVQEATPERLREWELSHLRAMATAASQERINNDDRARLADYIQREAHLERLARSAR